MGTTVTTYFLPDPAHALLHDTVRATLFDLRVNEEICIVSRHEAPARDEDESATEYALRIWRDVLPRRGDVQYEFRTTVGWTRDEIRLIVGMLTTTARVVHPLLRERLSKLAVEWESAFVVVATEFVYATPDGIEHRAGCNGNPATCMCLQKRQRAPR